MALFTCQSDLSKAQLLEATTFENEQVFESQLRDLLEDHLPALLPQRPLMVIASEYGNWSNASRFIDLLALDTEGQLVVVEIKRTGDGGHAELQALRYAAMLSTHTLDNVIDARYRHRLKKEPAVLREQARDEILGFLGKSGDGHDLTLGTTPQIILIARDFSPEITTTAMWLMERMEAFSCTASRWGCIRWETGATPCNLICFCRCRSKKTIWSRYATRTQKLPARLLPLSDASAVARYLKPVADSRSTTPCIWSNSAILPLHSCRLHSAKQLTLAQAECVGRARNIHR